MSTNVLLVFCTCPDQDTARRVAEQLVDRRLAACINLLPGVTSVYTWQGRRESAQEVQLLIKTGADRYPALERALQELHPYELAEIIAVPVEQGLTAYLDWVAQCTREPN